MTQFHVDHLPEVEPAAASDLFRLRPPPMAHSPRPGHCDATVLFLDFDGVLHPATGRSCFAYLDRFEALLADYPRLTVVFSTSWQQLSAFEQLKGVFVPELRDRIEGGTAQLAPCGFAEREALAAAWMRLYGRGRRWIALDDDSEGFAYRSEHLLWCLDGFAEGEDALLRAWLQDCRPIQDLITARTSGDPRQWNGREAIALVATATDDGGNTVVPWSMLPPALCGALLECSVARTSTGDVPLGAWRKWLRERGASGSPIAQGPSMPA